MRIQVFVSSDELKEMDVDKATLLRNVLEDLDGARDYSGFSVEVIVTEDKE